ncbi:MAG: cytochrome C biogenesis protein CcsA [Cellvibrionaceae bacterium]|nr:cytochrome C biogenesis protein CcsA [Cellvibrionaceae bacterium]
MTVRVAQLLRPCFLVCGLIFLHHAAFSAEPISPIPDFLPHDPVKAALGRRLFSDVRLSKDDTLSCESCHFLDRAGVDFLDKSVGINEQVAKRNSPTVFNIGLNFRQLWDGRAETLEQQVMMVVTNPKVMGMDSWDAVVAKISAIGTYQQAFEEAYGEPVNAENIQHAISEYERTLLTPNSPFDRFLKGDKNAISQEAKLGYQYFKAYGCVSCHQGANVGGNLFQKMGVLKDINLRADLSTDLGRYSITGNEWDKRVFKVPSLRLVTLTPPYFHDGSVSTLSEAIDIMIEFQLGRQVPSGHKDAIIEFLKTLPGEWPLEAKQ